MIAIVGAGLAGLTAAIRLAEAGERVCLFEAAPEAGGRTRSFRDPADGGCYDNGPHLLIGAYRATRRLLEDCNAAGHVHWQSHLTLPLWDAERGHFSLRPSPRLPLSLSMLATIGRLPGHSHASAIGMLKLAFAKKPHADQTAQAWLASLHLPEALYRDLLLPLCLGSMNEYPDSAPATSFRRVLKESFASHDTARLGWFTAPLSEALIAPLARRAAALGVEIRCQAIVRTIDRDRRRLILGDGRKIAFDRLVLATSPVVADRLCGQAGCIETHPITNLHLWYEQSPGIADVAGQPLVGGIGTLGQWFFDVSAQMRRYDRLHHVAVVISADMLDPRRANWTGTVTAELAELCKRPELRHPRRWRIVAERRATVLTRCNNRSRPAVPAWLVDASERPLPGELPATIEAAVRRGEKAASLCLMSQS